METAGPAPSGAPPAAPITAKLVLSVARGAAVDAVNGGCGDSYMDTGKPHMIAAGVAGGRVPTGFGIASMRVKRCSRAT